MDNLVMTTTDETAPVRAYIEAMLPWAHGYQLKGLTDYVIATWTDKRAIKLS